MAANTLKPKTLLSSSRQRELENQASKLALTLAASEDLTASLSKAVEIDFTNKLTTAEVHFSLFNMFETEEEIADWPVIGSMEGYTDGKPFDQFRYKDIEGKEQTASYWRMVANHHPLGAEYNRIKKEIDDGGKDGVKNEYTSLSDGDRERKKADINGKFTTFFGKLKLAVQLYHQMADANDRLKSVVDVDYDREVIMDGKKPKVDTDGTVMTEINMKSPRIICVSDKARKGVSKYFTIANFLRLDVDLAIAAGGTYADFISSNKRGTTDDENEAIVEETVKIVHPVDWENVTIQSLHYMNGIKNSVPLHKGLLAFYNAAGSDDRLMTLFNLAEVLTVLTENPDLKKRAEALGVGTQTPAQAAAAVAKRKLAA